jgi:tetratricopeptide (TPR) repeat protein
MHEKIQKIIQLQQKQYIQEAKNGYIELLNETHLPGDMYIIYANLGNILYSEKDYEKARKYYESALSYDNKDGEIYYNIAMTFLMVEELEKARDCLLKAIELNPKYFSAYVNLGVVNKNLDLIDEAVLCFETAIDINPDVADAFYNYANVFLKKEQFNAALTLFSKALTLEPKNFYKIYYSMGLVYQSKCQYSLALGCYDKSLESKKDYADARFAKATISLLMGDFKNGWRDYGYRWDASNDLKIPDYTAKRLQNFQEVENKKILVQQEQGYGDNIQFVRYVYKLVELNAQVYLAVTDPLYRIFSSIPYINLLKSGDVVGNIDYFTPLLDLPRIFYDFQDELLCKTKYIDFIREDIFEVRDKNKFNVGFVWRGNPGHKGDKKRSVALENFEILFKNEGIDFYSLQYENSEELDEYVKIHNNIYDCKNLISDFNDTANIIWNLDLVITVDSSMVHLCGALGKKAYLILGKNNDWRWLLNRDDSIWYDSVKIFRQDELGFDKVFERIALSVSRDCLHKSAL